MPRRTDTKAVDLAAIIADLNAIGVVLLLNFHTRAFRACTRLTRTVRSLHTPHTASSELPDLKARSNAALIQVKLLQSAITELPGISKLHQRRLAKVAATLTAYRASLDPRAAKNHIAS